MTSSNPLNLPPHISSLLSRLHAASLEQEAAIHGSSEGKVFSSNILKDLQTKFWLPASLAHDSSSQSAGGKDPKQAFDSLMLDKFIALDEDKCHFTYQLITAMGATNVVEAGTSFGVSTIYLALAVDEVKKSTGKEGKVIATEKEESKAQIARSYWNECGEEVEANIDLRIGDLLETLKQDVPGQINLLLLDSKSSLQLSMSSTLR